MFGKMWLDGHFLRGLSVIGIDVWTKFLIFSKNFKRLYSHSNIQKTQAVKFDLRIATNQPMLRKINFTHTNMSP